VVEVLPQTQALENPIPLVYLAVPVAPELSLVELCESPEPVLHLASWGGGLFSVIPEHLSTSIDCAISITIKHKPGVIREWQCPAHEIWPNN
jgi:hypothetical protein